MIPETGREISINVPLSGTMEPDPVNVCALDV